MAKKETEKKELGRLNMYPLLEIRDRSILHPEDFQIGSLEMHKDTVDRIATEFNATDLEVLYGHPIKKNKDIEPGAISVHDIHGKFIDKVMVANEC